MILKRNTEPQNFSQNSPKIQKYLGIIYLLSITFKLTLKTNGSSEFSMSRLFVVGIFKWEYFPISKKQGTVK